jgi:hypothetical protein
MWMENESANFLSGKINCSTQNLHRTVVLFIIWKMEVVETQERILIVLSVASPTLNLVNIIQLGQGRMLPMYISVEETANVIAFSRIFSKTKKL